jgi:spore germination protein
MEKTKNNTRLTSFQIFSLLLGGMLGFGALNISRYATVAVGRDGWISVLLAGVIIIINSFIMVRLSNKFPNKTIIQYSQEIIGKFFGKALGLIFVASAICLSGVTLSITAFVINSWILTFTPPYIIYVTMLFACFYVCL